MITVYTNTGRKNIRVSEAFANGCNAQVRPATDGLRAGDFACYGLLRGIEELWEEAKAQGRPWYYMDNAYFDRDKYYRVTRNAKQYRPASGHRRPRPSYDRMLRLGLPWQPVATTGRHILIAQQTDLWYEMNKLTSKRHWTEHTREEIRYTSNRPIVVRAKGSTRPLSRDLEDCWAVVTHTSNTAVDAVVAGIPVFTNRSAAAATMGMPNLSYIEEPFRPHDNERKNWAAHLANNQWTLDEMRDGTCWRDLHV